MKSTYRYTLVYNLKKYAKDIYLPSAFVASIDTKGELQYIQKKASTNAFKEFKLLLEPFEQQLLLLIEKLQLSTLEKKYNPTRRKPKPLTELMQQDRTVAKSIQTYIHRLVDQFLTLIVQHDLVLCWDVEKKVLIKDVRVQIAQNELTPHLFFTKTREEVKYRLWLSDQTGKWRVNEKDVVPITNIPAWVFVDYQLYKIPHINGLMLKPFQKKDEVVIAAKFVKTYFESFILKIASEVDMQTEGFKVVDKRQLQFCQLEWIEDIFSKTEGLKVTFVYSGVHFGWNDSTKRRSGLQFEKDDVVLTRINRNFSEEKKWIEKLKTFDLVNEVGSYFQLVETVEAPSLFTWLAQNEQRLEAANFKVVTPQREGKSLVLAVPTIAFDATRQVNDWFDIRGIIVVGDFKIPFQKIVPYLKKEDRYYPLPNGKYFLIPEEWFMKFSGLLRFATLKNDTLKLAKSQYTLLENLGIDLGKALEQELTDFDYSPSDNLKATLRPYQLAGVKWLLGHYQNELGACLADDMGLGKTLQTIAVLLYAKEQEKTSIKAPQKTPTAQLDLFGATAYPTDIYQPLRAIIILPASLVFNWEREIRKFAPSLLVYKHVGAKRHTTSKLVGSFDVILTTYHTALRDVDVLEKIDFQYIILDESQQIKNKDSKIFKAINQLNGTHKISLSGTPIENSLSDLWAQMQFINPNMLGSFRFFQKEYIRPIEKQQDEDKKAQLQQLIQPYLLRRTKESVAKDLPELTTKIFYTQMTAEQQKLYEKEKSAARNFLLDNFDASDGKYQFQVLSSLTKLRQLANHPVLTLEDYAKESGKFKDVLEHLEVIHKGGHKTLLFSSFVKHLNLYQSHFQQQGKAFAQLTGELSQKERKRQVDEFESNSSVQSFLISIKAGGTGLNLTAADYVFILDPWWNPSIERQAIARAHRIGQTKRVFAIKFITKDSIEEKILKLQERKTELADAIIEGKAGKSFSKKELQFLLS
ncbi:MAG: DEAD/DEAH box helicase [Bacteroidota bacterium]